MIAFVNTFHNTTARRRLASGDLLNKRLEMFGKLTGPAVTRFLKDYETALRGSKQAADELANAQARLGLRDQIAGAQAALNNVGNPYAGRLAANELQAGIAARRDPAQARSKHQRKLCLCRW